MAVGFPPTPIFPTGIDNDYTLFLVNNTTETILAEDNSAWSDEIVIKPVSPLKTEIWADNGFCNIDGELIYYDAVEKNANNKVFKLKRCSRNLGGKKTKFNPAGTWVRGFVIAEHHNQLVDCIVKVEDFIGIDFDPRPETLDYRIRNLRETPIIFDDFSCPDVTLNFQIIENNPSSGILARYLVEIDGSFNSFRLDFGDGEFTTSDQEGTHRYSLNSQIDPVVTVTNNKCQILQTPINRQNPAEPTPVIDPPIFDIPIPEFIEPPIPVIPVIEQPKVEFNIPPTIFPCMEINPIQGISIVDLDIQFPSVISFTPLNIPSFISISPVNIPNFISISPVNIPSQIGFAPAPSFAPIQFGTPPSISPINVDINIAIDASDIPSCIPLCDAPSSIAVDWGSPPTLNVAFVQGITSQSVRKRKKTQAEIDLQRELGEEFQDLFADDDEDNSFQVEYNNIGIPHEITLISPEFNDIKVISDIPTEINVKFGNIPNISIDNIKEIPKQIEIVNLDVPSTISVISEIPSIITVVNNIPNEIKLIGINIPDSIPLEIKGLPESIQVKGIPNTIELKAPESIRLKLDENIEVPLVYKGPPIEMKLEMPKEWTTKNPEANKQCFMISPCE